jgi:hypothetical protein
MLVALLLLAGTANAESATERVTRQLRSLGYEQISITRTWLGRIRFLAIGPAGRREVVVDPRNGEILRDFLERTDHVTVAGQLDREEREHEATIGDHDPEPEEAEPEDETEHEDEGEQRDDDTGHDD